MSRQLAAAESQRRHWYLRLIGVLPVQVPAFTVSVSPSVAVPEIVGGLEFVGAVPGSEAPDPPW
jgi:hypothetical protein